MKVRVLAYLCSVAVLTAHCRQVSSAAVGQWESPAANIELGTQFQVLNDGKCVVASGISRPSCSWDRLDNARIQIELSVGGVTRTFLATVNGDLLNVSAAQKVTTYYRSGSNAAREARVAQVTEDADRKQRDDDRKQAISREVRQLLTIGRRAVDRKAFDDAIAPFQKAADLRDPAAQNELAWFYATCPVSRYRDGAKAVEYAKAAVDHNPKSWAFADTLAAAYARNGQFDLAVQEQHRSLDLLRVDLTLSDAERDRLLSELKGRAALFERHQPFAERGSSTRK